jgi:CHASE3 domain sensor protein
MQEQKNIKILLAIALLTLVLFSAVVYLSIDRSEQVTLTKMGPTPDLSQAVQGFRSYEQ